MPKDDWAKAARKAKGNQVAYAKASSRRRRRNGNAKSIKRLQTPQTRLWFGKHKGKRLCKVPLEYLVWLSGVEPKNWQMRALVEYLKTYVKGIA